MQRFYQYNVGVAEYDLDLFPLYRVKGQEWPQLPGLLTSIPPKRPARGREDDRLVLFLTLSGNTPFSTAEYTQVTTQMAQRFYRTAGSLTSAIRSTAEALNQFLLQRNLRTTGKGQYIIGRLIMGVLRGSQFFLAQCGPTHAFHLRKGESRQIHDSQIAGRGLGFAQTAPAYFFQFELKPGDLLVLCTSLPSGWDTALLEDRSQAADPLRRKLASITDDDLNAIIIRVQTGKGNLNISARHPAASETVAPQPASAVESSGARDASRPTSQVQSEHPAGRFAHLLNGARARPAPEPALPPKQAGQTQQPPRTASTPQRDRRGNRFVSPRAPDDIPEIKRPISRRRQSIFRGLAMAIRGIRTFGKKASDRLRVFLPSLLPGTSDGETHGGSGMAFLAIVIPLVIVTIAAVIYTRFGSVTQYQENYAKALEQASLARGQADPAEVRLAWERSLYYLDRADSYQRTQDSQDLRQQAQTALDNMDGILRLDFHKAIIGALSHSVEISRMAATDTDLYLLDAGRGTILRAYMTSQGYEVDTSFSCDPGQYGTTVVGALIDLAALPMSNIYNARILAMDGNGTLLYCGLSDPVAVPLVPPQLGWRGITAFTLDSDGKNLYILDPTGNAIWQYAGAFGEFTDLPIMFFGEQVPQNMSTAIDLAANSADLYLLYQDGHITACPQTRYDVAPMRCTDPATFVDTRPERQPGPKINDAIFTRMTFASPPDPSLYMLESLTRAVYRFSPRADSIELRGQFRPSAEQNNDTFSGPATAMAISPNRYIFLSIGNQVYFATDVP